MFVAKKKKPVPVILPGPLQKAQASGFGQQPLFVTIALGKKEVRGITAAKAVTSGYSHIVSTVVGIIFQSL